MVRFVLKPTSKHVGLLSRPCANIKIIRNKSQSVARQRGTSPSRKPPPFACWHYSAPSKWWSGYRIQPCFFPIEELRSDRLGVTCSTRTWLRTRYRTSLHCPVHHPRGTLIHRHLQSNTIPVIYLKYISWHGNPNADRRGTVLVAENTYSLLNRNQICDITHNWHNPRQAFEQ